MKYQLEFTKTAERDLNSALDYIELTLKNPDAADRLLDDTEQAMLLLQDFPKSHPLIADPVLSAWGIRFIKIGHYLAFYTIRGDKIVILRYLYEKRNWTSILREIER